MAFHHTAKGLAALGRNGDSTLMHVNPQEVAALSKILGPTTTNPKTGLPEAYGWSNMLGSVLGGVGSFGIGAALEPVIGDAIGEGIIGDVLRKAVPALTGAGIGAAIGGATGGKAGAMGGAAQGLLSGGLGAYASEDVLGAPTKPVTSATGDPTVTSALNADPTSITQKGLGSTTGQATIGLKGAAQDTPSAEEPGFFDNLGKLGQGGFKKYEDYMPYLFQAGMIGNALTAQKEAQDTAAKTQQQSAQYALGQRLHAQNMANQWYAGYADGGPVQFQTQGPLPVSVRIPEHAVEEAKRAGGLGSFMSFANGGYINTQPFSPDQFHPQSRIPSAQPYAAASPQRAEVVNQQGAMYAQGGLIDGEGDGMSDDIDANIEGQEPVRVADGEYVIPRHIVDMIGTDRLDELLKQVRRAAHGKDTQINEDAGLKAAKRELGLA